LPGVLDGKIDLLSGGFFCCGELAFLLVFLQKIECTTWFFGGQLVVECMVKLGHLTDTF
jgi:hypothetical protein